MAVVRELLIVVVCIAGGAWCQCVRPSSYVSVWSSGFEAEFKIPVAKAVSGWKAQLKFSHATKTLDIWDAAVTSSNADKSLYNLGPDIYNRALAAGSTLEIGFVVAFADRAFDTLKKRPFPQNEPCITFNQATATTPATSRPASSQPAASGTNRAQGVVATNTKYNYDQVMGLSILFYEAQRSGKQPADKLVSWRGDSSLGDKGVNGEDLTGGWHDAGDHVKFGFPMAGATTMLLAGMIFFEDGYRAAGKYDQALRQIKWPLDYFIKCHVSQKRFYGQVGDGDIDHAWWGRPEDMKISRPAFYVGDGSGGADLLGETAAALAAGSILFKTKDAKYSGTLLTHARQIFEMAKANLGVYHKVITDAAAFYNSNEYRDELAHAAAWLALATGEAAFRTAAISYLNQVPGTPWALDWSDKRPLAHVLMYHMTKSATYKTEVSNFLKQWLPGGTVQRTPKGLAWRAKWGSLRYSANSALLALIAAKEGINQATYIAYAKSQIHYMLGDSGRSFVVGFGTNYPKRPHHKAASCPARSVKNVCDWSDFSSTAVNPNILKGALVGGPDEMDKYEDVRSNYVTNEVTCDYNAGFQGAVAGLKYFALKGLLA